MPNHKPSASGARNAMLPWIQQNKRRQIYALRRTLISRASSSIRNEIKKLDPGSASDQYCIATMEERLSNAVAQPRFRTTLIGLFAITALILACIGIYGVISHSVAQRTHEIDIRMALGARGVDVLRMVVREAIADGGCWSRVGTFYFTRLGQPDGEVSFWSWNIRNGSQQEILLCWADGVGYHFIPSKQPNHLSVTRPH